MHHTRGYERMVNLSDAVVAIAATLLILPLVDEASTFGKAASAPDLGAFLADNIPNIAIFALSFAVIARFWLIHHALYRQIVGYTTPLVIVNFIWLFSIVFLPFPTELLAADGPSSRISSGLYVGTLLLTSLSGAVQQLLIVRRPEIQVDEVRGTLTAIPAFLAVGAIVIAFVLAAFVPGVGEWSLLLLFLTGPVERVLLARRRHSPTPGRETPAPL